MTQTSSRTEVAPSHAETRTALRAQLEELRSDRLAQLAQVSEALVGEDELNAPREAELRRVLNEIDAALNRLDNGTYGTCEHCGASIPTERLEIVPHARHCVACQQATKQR